MYDSEMYLNKYMYPYKYKYSSSHLKVLVDNFKIFLKWKWAVIVNTEIRAGPHFKSAG